MLGTIKSSTEISTLFAQGKRYNAPFLTLIVNANLEHDQAGRVAFIAGKKLGNAVWRNQAKRRMRVLCRDLGGPWVGYDVIFLAKPRINNANYSKVLDVCDELLTRAL